MSTQTPFTDREIANQYTIGNFAAFSDEEILSFAKFMHAFFERSPAIPDSFKAWLVSEIEEEARRRDSDGRIEMKMVAIPLYMFSMDERQNILTVIHAIRDANLWTDAQRDFIKAIHWNLVMSFVIAAKYRRTKLLSKQQVGDILQLSNEGIQQLVKAGKLPKPIRLSPKHLRWSEDAVLDAIVRLHEDENGSNFSAASGLNSEAEKDDSGF